MVYGIGPELPAKIETWRQHGYIIHVMTGVAWGNYQDYLYGRFDGINHEDEAQTQKNGEKIGHGGDVYYMSPGINYGKFLTQGVKRALDAGAGTHASPARDGATRPPTRRPRTPVGGPGANRTAHPVRGAPCVVNL